VAVNRPFSPSILTALACSLGPSAVWTADVDASAGEWFLLAEISTNQISVRHEYTYKNDKVDL
jgi:hypothetical protein